MGTNILRRDAVRRTTNPRAPTAEISRQELHGLIDQTASPVARQGAEPDLEPELELVDAPEAPPVGPPGAPRLAHTLRRDSTPAIAIGRPTRVMPPSAVAALVQSGALASPPGDAREDDGPPSAPAVARTVTFREPALSRAVTPTSPTLARAATALARTATARLARAPRHRQLFVIALLAAAFAELAFLTLRAIFR